MKKVIMLALLASATWAVDFSQMSTEELMSMRGTISVSDRPAFRAEMQKRMQTMTPAQRQQFMQGSPGGGQGMGKGMNSQRVKVYKIDLHLLPMILTVTEKSLKKSSMMHRQNV